MPEYTYLLETRLSAAQQNALAQVRDAARDAGMVVFLAGGAVRDLTTGSSVRDLDFAVQGNALQLQSALESRGAILWGRHEPTQSLFLWFPGSVRVELSSTRSETFPKPGKPVYAWAGIVDDLYRRDFTVNAMALSLNEGSYGLLLDPLNGVADTEARQLRLVSNYGFIEDPSRLLRAVRLSRRMGWALEERTEARYQNAKESSNFGDISDFHRGYELEEIAVEEDSLAALKAFEAEGWMEKLFPGWGSSQADIAALDSLHRVRIQLLMQGIAPDLTAAHLELLTARMKPESKNALKHLMVRPGLLAAWEGLDAAAKDFGKLLTGKEMAVPSAAWKLFHTHAAEPVLWLAYAGKGSAEAKFKQMFTVWPEVAKKVPVAMMTELRITPELPGYEELLHELFLQQIDGKLETDEQMRAFLETYSPPAPPPPVSLKRSRAKKSAAKGKRKGAARDLEGDRDDEHEDDKHDQDEDPDSDDFDAGASHESDDDSGHDEDDTESDSEDLPVKARPATPKAVEKAMPAKKAAPPKSAPEKTGPLSAREKAAAGEVNLDGVDIAAVLGRIQSAGGFPSVKKKTASAPVKAAGKPATPAQPAVAEEPAVKMPAAQSPARTSAKAPVSVKSSAPKTEARPVAATVKKASGAAKNSPVAATKKAVLAKAGKPSAGKPAAAGKSAAALKPKAKPPAKAVVKTSAAGKSHKAPVPIKKASQAKAAPAPVKKKTIPATKNAAAKLPPTKSGKAKASVKKQSKSSTKPVKKATKR